MKKRIFSALLVISLALSALLTTVSSADREPAISAKGATLINTDTGCVYYEKNATLSLPMASTTKIMTAITVIESSDINREFTVSDSAVGVEGSSAYLKSKDRLTIDAALHALLLQSANDASNALAIEVGGDLDTFVQMMNKKARELGLYDTFFENPSGLPSKNHRTTALDLARLASYCMKNDTFKSIVAKKTETVTVNGESRVFVNHNKLLSLYDGCIGLKTGYTVESGRCLVSCAEKNGISLICVTLNAPDDWNDHKKLFDYGFASLKSMKLTDKSSFIVELPILGSNDFIRLYAQNDTYAVLKKDAVVTTVIESLPIICDEQKADRPVAYAVFLDKEREIARVPLITKNEPLPDEEKNGKN